MSKFPWTQVENHGGIAGSIKMGPPASFAYGRGLETRTDPTSVTMTRMPKKDSATIVTGLIVDMIRLPSGKFVAVDNAGNVYSRTAALAGTWTNIGTLTDVATACSLVYNLQQDMVYIPGQKNIHTITNADQRFGGSVTVNNNALTRTLDRSTIDSTNTYTTTTLVQETALHTLYVTPTIEPTGSIKLFINTKGTAGNVKVWMHDQANNTIASITKTPATLTNGQMNEFEFTVPVRNTVKPNATTYHFHVTHQSGGGTATTIGCATASDFSTARYETYTELLLGTPYGNGMHPMINFLQYMLIGNERYVTAWEVLGPGTPTNFEYVRHRVVLEPGYSVTSFALWGEYVCIAAEKRATANSNVIDGGRLYFWDGVSAGWNFAVDTPEGAPYGAFSYGNVIYYKAAGALWATVGSKPIKIAQLPNTLSDGSGVFYMIDYPNTMAVLNTILHFGFASDTNDRNIEHGVYTFGAADKNYDESLNFSYRSSQGGLTNDPGGSITMHVGMVKAFGPLLFISYYDNGSYFVDLLDPTCSTSNTYPSRRESLVYDAGRPDKYKQAVYMRVDCSTRLTGGGFPGSATLRMYYKIDRQGTWQTDGKDYTNADFLTDLRYFQMPINKRFREIQVAWEVQGIGDPMILATTVLVETLAGEAD